MNYKETVEYLFNSTPVFEHVGATAYKDGLDNSHALDAHFGHPHTRYRTIHVAGTNGKGSSSHTLASILQADGHRVGLYTSPHLVDFRERIRVNGVMMPEEYVVDFVREERSFFEPLHPSFFELTTALAFKYFAEQEVDIAVVEVGLGGRLDCTNIITPQLSIITNISVDHTQFLGHTLPEIAHEKAGIIKPHVPVVVGEAVAETRLPSRRRRTRAGARSSLPRTVPRSFLPTTRPRVANIRRGPLARSWATCVATTGRATPTPSLASVSQLLSQGTIRHPESIGEGFRSVCRRTGLMGRWQPLPAIPMPSATRATTWRDGRCWLPGSWPSRPASAASSSAWWTTRTSPTSWSSCPATPPTTGRNPRPTGPSPAEKVAACGRAHGLHGTLHPSVAEAYRAALADAAPRRLHLRGWLQLCRGRPSCQPPGETITACC